MPYSGVVKHVMARHLPHSIYTPANIRRRQKVESILLKWHNRLVKAFSMKDAMALAKGEFPVTEAAELVADHAIFPDLGIKDALEEVLGDAAQSVFVKSVGYAADEDIAKGVARDRAERLFNDMNKTDAGKIGEIVAKSVSSDMTVEETAQAIMAFVKNDQMTPERAQMIATTEVNEALAQAGQASATQMGFTTKEWVTDLSSNVCETCVGNEEQGPIGIEEEFISGDLTPTAHPNCACWLVYSGE